MIFTSSSCQVSHATTSDGFRATGQTLKALIFDVDGTLYDQGLVRRAMLYRLLRAHVTSPVRGFFTLQVLHAYRKAQETLRTTPPEWRDIASTQLQLAGRRVGMSAEVIAPCVARWMEHEPLSLLASSVRKGIVKLLQDARECGLRLAVCSDYPADRKLAAMGIADLFDVVVTAQDAEVQRFKPDPAGLELTLRRLDVAKSDVLYIGDRADVDALAASRAGIRHFILNGTHSVSELSQLVSQPSLVVIPKKSC